MNADARLRVLAVDDEPPALDELAWLLREDERVGEVLSAGDAAEALRTLHRSPVDAVLLDVSMPGLDGVELARVLGQFASPPAIVFVTASDRHAVEAFELHAVDYLLKPVRAARVAEAITRVVKARQQQPVASGEPVTDPSAGAPREARDAREDGLPVIVVDAAGRTRRVLREEVRFVEACGDYVRLHTGEGAPLARVSMGTLEHAWAPWGFVRVHRRFLVALSHVSEVRFGTGAGNSSSVVVAGREIPVSRRQAREVKDHLLQVARRER